MIDMHTHVLPFVDDGAKDVEMSLEMLKIAKEQGVDLVAATPHFRPSGKENPVERFLEKRNKGYAALAEKLTDSQKYPEIILGAEVYLSCDVSEFANLRELCYQNTDYILLEMPLDREPSVLAEWVYNVTIKGLKPVIAHIDRYSHYKQLMAEFEGLDVVYQVNASEFFSFTGKMILKNVFKRHDKFLVSTDMHNLTSRPCCMDKARAVCTKKFSGMTDMLFENTAKTIVENGIFA